LLCSISFFYGSEGFSYNIVTALKRGKNPDAEIYFSVDGSVKNFKTNGLGPSGL